MAKDGEKSLEALRHTASHIMAQAVKQLFPEALLGIGPAIEAGFYYDFAKVKPFTPKDLTKIEEKMREIIKLNLPLIKIEMEKEEAKKLLRDKGEKYKLELLDEIPEDVVTFYQQGDFIDLCQGPHLSSTGEVNVFKLISTSGAYWRGDEKRDMLQRIYGTAFFTQTSLDEYLYKIEEAERRDHRKLGRELDLFNIYEEVGPGLIFWHPKAAIIRHIIENFWIAEHQKRGYQLVYTPHIAKIDLWKISGHLDFYQENMYKPMEVEEQSYLIKPMNCPGHILIYKSKKRSYRELPIRFAELGTVYRYERSGVLHGLLRVRGFTQDDAHIFCTPEQLKEEMMGAVELADFMMKTFGFYDYDVVLATRPEKFAGTSEEWDQAEATLAEALKERGIKFEIDEGGAVFYGPKIDIKLKDALNRLWQGPTIQFDFNLPRRFNVSYVGEDNKEHLVVMVHRAVLGSLERFMGALIEHYAGAFPFWLAPEQIRILPIASRHLSYTHKIKEKLSNFRVTVDERNEKLNYKIRQSQIEKIPYVLIVGDKEEKEEKVSIRSWETGDEGKMTLEEFKERFLNKMIT